MRIKYHICILLITIFLLPGCGERTGDELPAGLRYDVEGVLPIDDFSGEECDQYDSDNALHYCFSPIEVVTYKHDGVAETIDSDDPRVIRLLNFMMYSESQGKTMLQQSYVDANHLESLVKSNEDTLEIIFEAENDERGTPEKPERIIICGDTFLTMFSYEDCLEEGPVRYAYKGMAAVRYWPYAELLYDYAKKRDLDPTELTSFAEWGSGYWIDLLKYAGFQ